MSDFQALFERIDNEVLRCMTLAKATYGQDFSKPKVLFASLGRTAGNAKVHAWTVTLNKSLLLSATDEIIGQTLPHELAHLIDFALHPWNFTGVRDVNGFRVRNKRNIHGPTWKAIMRLFGKQPKRCHSMDTTLSARTVQKRHIYSCQCGREHTLGPRHHLKVQRYGGGRPCGIRWKQCALPIEASRYVGLSQRTQDQIAARNAARSK